MSTGTREYPEVREDEAARPSQLIRGVGPTEMSRDEARALLTAHLARYRTHPYSRLVELVGSVETADIRGADGTIYQLEVEFFWDDRTGGDIRVLAAIDGGGISTLRPMTDDFIKAPPGDYVGERSGR